MGGVHERPRHPGRPDPHRGLLAGGGLSAGHRRPSRPRTRAEPPTLGNSRLRAVERHLGYALHERLYPATTSMSGKMPMAPLARTTECNDVVKSVDTVGDLRQAQDGGRAAVFSGRRLVLGFLLNQPTKHEQGASEEMRCAAGCLRSWFSLRGGKEFHMKATSLIAAVRMALSRRVRRGLAVVCCTTLASLGALPLSAGASSPSPSEPGTPSVPGHVGPDRQGGFAPYSGGDVSLMAESGNITAGSCTYRQAIDDPHISSSSPLAASIHGWWVRVSGSCPSRSNVDTYLQAYWCDFYGCRWITVASNSADVYAGGGSGNRVTARKTCRSSKTVGWRGFVDVDLIGVSDPSGYTYSTIRDLGCEPS